MARELGPAIARPSIVMGESDTGWTPAFNVLYWPMQAYSRGLFKELPALPSGRVDIVPVDYVADALVHLLDRREAGVFNLVAGRNAATVDELTTLASEYFGKPVPPFVDPVDPDSDDHDSVYVPYFDMRVVFDDARARSVLVPAGIEAPPLREYFPKLMEYAQAVRWGKQKMTREAARTRRAELAAT